MVFSLAMQNTWMRAWNVALTADIEVIYIYISLLFS